MEPGIYYFNNLNEIKTSCEKLITETQCDIEIFRNEQQHLQKDIQEIVIENNLINSKLEVLKSCTNNITPTTLRPDSESRDDATREKLTNDALQNIRKQIDYLKAENNDFRSLNENLQKTIANLENEIQNYRNQLFKPISVCEIKQKYANTITILENSIKHQNSELKTKTQIIEDLIAQNTQLTDRIEKAEELLNEKSEEIQKLAQKTEITGKLQEQLTESERHNRDLLKSLKVSRQAIEKKYKLEQIALQKVGEALRIAEAAVNDKEEALKREKIAKEECDNIASTIGQVMDEAVCKAKLDMEAIKNKYIEQEEILYEEKQKLNEEIQNQKKFIQILYTRCKRFQQKYANVSRDNKNLSDKLGLTSKTLSHLEEKFEKLCHNNEENQRQTSVEDDNEIQQFVKSNRELKERYKEIINELTKNFELKICNLQDEITRIKTENQLLKYRKNV